MSGILKSAAMGLLSRTLTALLYKYLKDVDVEGVALPSLTSSSDGHSGWGVRLSNVKLQPGAKLMDLKGAAGVVKRKKKKSRKKQKQQSHEKQQLKPPFPNQPSDEKAQSKDGDGPPQSETPAGAVAAEELVDDAQSVPTLAESEESSQKTSNNKKEPPKKKTSWFGGWYSSPSAPPQKEEEPETKVTADSGLTETENKEDQKADTDEKDGSGDIVAHNNSQGEMDNDKEDEDEDHLIPMILRLGPNGVIGTLDIRLVGKEVHVLVEDADLTLEAVRIRPPKGEGDADDGAAATTAGESTSSTASSGAPSSSSSSKTPKPKKEPETVSERIIDENILARILSVLPNLLLREMRLRLIIRQDPIDFEDAEIEESSSRAEGEAENASKPFAPDADDPVIDVGIELLSITDGQDFFAHFRSSGGDDGDGPTMHGDHYDDVSSVDSMEEDDLDDDDDPRFLASKDHPPAVTNTGTILPKNEYMNKRIRTGRGTEGGIVVRLYPGCYDPDAYFSGEKWSRQAWRSSIESHCFVRCSGVDLQARIFMGLSQQTQLQLAGTMNTSTTTTTSWYGGEIEDDYDVDAMLFSGIDYIVPGPQPPALPPIAEDDDNKSGTGNNVLSGTASSANASQVLWELPGATTYQLDTNGIQSSWIDSSFHRVARGLMPTTCQNSHLPCEYCSQCWQTVSADTQEDAEEHTLDSAAPLGGLVLQCTIRDVLEVNVDRASLDVIGMLIQLFKKPRQKNAESAPPAENDSSGKEDSLDISNASRASESKSHESATVPVTPVKPQITPNETTTSSVSDSAALPARQRSTRGEEEDYGDTTNAFPSYMQPEKIQYLGIHLADVHIKIHLMQDPTSGSDSGYNFSYWDAALKCITMDWQRLSGDVKAFQDIRLDAGHVTVHEHLGVERKQIVSMGLRQRIVDFDDVTVETLMTREGECQRPPWPSTAAVLLDIPPPLETLVYESRERHAIQLRYVALRTPPLASRYNDDTPVRNQSMIHVKLGASSIELPRQIYKVVRSLLRETRQSLFPPQPEVQSPATQPPSGTTKEEAKPVSTRRDNLMRYKADLDGARLRWGPNIHVRLPLSTIGGELSSASGFLVETLLEHVSLQYGQKEHLPVQSLDRLPLAALTNLSESLRLRILFFLDDLQPLARALGVDTDTPPLLLYKAINKQMDKLVTAKKKTVRRGKSHGASTPGSASAGVNRRQNIMNELLKLDDDALEDLWESHQRQKRRLGRQQKGGNRPILSTS